MVTLLSSPDVACLSKLRIGNHVKLCIASGGNAQGELLWVRVTKITETGYTGILDELTGSTPLQLGTILEFEQKHIYQIFK